MRNEISNILFFLISYSDTRFLLSRIHADINECEENSGICGHGKCINLIGAFKCFCAEGFQLDSSGKCIGKLSWPQIGFFYVSCLSHNGIKPTCFLLTSLELLIDFIHHEFNFLF
jgi:hypothetical protein